METNSRLDALANIMDCLFCWVRGTRNGYRIGVGGYYVKNTEDTETKRGDEVFDSLVSEC